MSLIARIADPTGGHRSTVHQHAGNQGQRQRQGQGTGNRMPAVLVRKRDVAAYLPPAHRDALADRVFVREIAALSLSSSPGLAPCTSASVKTRPRRSGMPVALK